jgi:hypothetical protein
MFTHITQAWLVRREDPGEPYACTADPGRPDRTGLPIDGFHAGPPRGGPAEPVRCTG